MWYHPEKYKKDIPDVNQRLLALKGELEDKEAKISLAQFLRANIGITTELISNVKLSPYQEIILKALLNRNFSLNIWGRGCGKTFIAAIYCFIQCIFVPGTKILVAGPTFRTARLIFNYLEKIVESKGSDLLRQAFSVKPSKRSDQFEWNINGGSITAIPLNGEKIRGFRANVLLLDEYLLLSEDIIQNVLMPFLVAPQNMRERIEVREIEDKLIADGLMKESERIEFPNTAKMIALSSASYTFENLYKTYKDWGEKIYNKEETKANYFISQLSYEVLPEHMIDANVIEEAKNGGASSSSFLREYCAQFTDGSDSFFNAKKMFELTIPDGEEPTVLLRGQKDKKYIIGIDPNMDDSPSADYFAMAVLEIDEKEKSCILVHGYSGLGSLSGHINYLYYILKNFNVVFACVDNAGADTFLGSCNASELFKNTKNQVNFLDFDALSEEYNKQLIQAKKNYNKEINRIFFTQPFTSEFIRRGNEYLQASIDFKKIWFASKISANGPIYNSFITQQIDYNLINEKDIIDFIDTQDMLIYQTKKQCALIQPTSTVKGNMSFDLPSHLKRNNSHSRARKDNYTALMLANWAAKCYFDIQENKSDLVQDTFTPVMF